MKRTSQFLWICLLSLALGACSDPGSRSGRGLNRGDRPRTPYQIKDRSLGGLDPAELEHLRDVAQERSCLLLNLDGDVLGSACIISRDGLAVTTARVVGSVEALRAQMGDIMIPTETVGVCKANNVALIQLRIQGSLPYFPLVPDQELAYDQPLVASSPNPNNGSLAAGFISGVNVSQWTAPQQFLYRGLLHTAPVFEGDFGGPLMDLRGRLVGLHSSVRGHVAAAVSVDTVLALLDDLKKGGEIAGIRPTSSQEEANWVVPGLIEFAVHESGSANQPEVANRLLESIEKYRELYVFLKQQTDDPAERFVSMVKHDISRLPE